MLKATLAQLITTKFLATAAVAAAATGGVALAAATGNLPTQLPGSPNVSASASGSSEEPSESAPGSESDEPSESSEASGASASPSPSLNGLCKAFQAGATSNPGKALENPAFSVLVAAAGGADGVAAYCTDLVGPAASHGAPATHPGNAPSHSTGAPATHPSGAPSHPTGHPTGEPTSVPARP